MKRSAIAALVVGGIAALILLNSSYPIVRRGAGGVIAERGYEELLQGRRAAVYRVTWSWADYEGRRVVRDVTQVRSRTGRRMLGTVDVFERQVDFDLLRTPAGELLYQKRVIHLAARTDTMVVRRTPRGYRVHNQTGQNEEDYEIDTDGPAQVDAETFLGPRIRAGRLKAGQTYAMRLLDPDGRRTIDSAFAVIGFDEEGPGLKVEETTLGNKHLWWFAEDGAVVRHRGGETVVRRADHLRLDDLPRTPAAYPITLGANVDLPRLFTSRKMVVDIQVQTDDTIQPPRIPPNPFTDVIRETSGEVRLLLRSHDDPAANTPLPIRRDGLEPYLRPTPLMEVDDAEIKKRAREAVGDAKDARTAATRIANYVFRLLRKGSPEMAEPTAKEILAEPVGDCSEHCLLFTTLCRAAGIPARRCSGYVCIGDDWGSHAWCEIWVGKWIGADPTTNEIGTRARYIFCARQDEPELPPAIIHAARTRILIRSAEYDDGSVDIEHHRIDPVVFSGIRLAKLPEGWRVKRRGRAVSILSRDFRVDARIQPDQGYRTLDFLRMRLGGGEQTTFGGRPAAHRRLSRQSVWLVSLGRQILYLYAAPRQAGAALPIEQIAAAFEPTLARDDG